MYRNNFICVIKHKGKVLREVNDEVTLPFGSQYSILLKNKDSRRALVDIEVDGENVLSGNSLIVDGHTSQEIKGFMRNMYVTNRFKFIRKTKEISAFRGDRFEDGVVSVSYRFERLRHAPIKILRDYSIYGVQDSCIKTGQPTVSPYDVKYAACFTGMGNNEYITKSSDSVPYVQDNYAEEEGITVRGSKTTQKYQYGDIDNLELTSYFITLKLKGMTKHGKRVVKKPLTTKTRLQCTTCGRRNKSSSKFCPNCGTYLERF